MMSLFTPELAIHHLSKEKHRPPDLGSGGLVGSAHPQGNRITKGNVGKIGKIALKAALSGISRKQGGLEIRYYSRLIVAANIAFGDISMSLKNRLENQGNRGAIALSASPHLTYDLEI
jgi:hypothetical protein